MNIPHIYFILFAKYVFTYLFLAVPGLSIGIRALECRLRCPTVCGSLVPQLGMEPLDHQRSPLMSILLTHPLMDTWAASAFLLLGVVLLGTWRYSYMFGTHPLEGKNKTSPMQELLFGAHLAVLVQNAQRVTASSNRAPPFVSPRPAWASLRTLVPPTQNASTPGWFNGLNGTTGIRSVFYFLIMRHVES